jgi:hypothetical protein
MAIDRPYYRIYRPAIGQLFPGYVYDARYATNRVSHIRAFEIIQSALKTVFEYIEPNDSNLNTYSHQLFQLFIRACMEVEQNAKAILLANGYTFKRTPNIEDYHKIEKATQLSECAVQLPFWSGSEKEIRPYESWKTGHTLSWYQEYNLVKHNREQNFHLANLRNVLASVTGLFALLFSQFAFEAFDSYHAVTMVQTDDETGAYSHTNCIFQIMAPGWSDADKYDIDWETLRKSTTPFQQFPF